MSGLHLATIPAHVPFLDTIATRWLAGHSDDLSRGLILLPTKRAARALADAFLRAGDGRPMLLPRITALGAIDEAPLTLAGALDLPPPVPAAQRLAVLSRMILALPEHAGGVRGVDRAWLLARELATLMDEAERAELDLPAALEAATDGAHAEHWQQTLRFLEIVTRAWPAWLAEQGMMNPAERQVKLLHAQASAWRERAPDEPVWAAGMTAGTKSVIALLASVARQESGLVVFPALDCGMADETWAGLVQGHNQAGLRDILHGIGARRDEVEIWDAPAAVPAGRGSALAAALLPAEALGAWRDKTVVTLGDLSRLEPADEQAEAVAIALRLRDAIEIPGARAALVTPDRALALRVTAELLRWGIVADDSAGEPLAQTPPAVFLRLLAHAVADDLAPVALLSLLKHPLAAAGLSPAACRNAARALERDALRGPKPLGGITGLREITDKHGAALVGAVEPALAPILRIVAAKSAAPVDMLAGLLESAEALAATHDTEGAARLWAHEEGEALATLLSEAMDAFEHLPEQSPSVLPGLLDAVLEGEVVRSRRALRGRTDSGEHPRIFIWGLLEARLQSVDVVVLGGMVEGVWPGATDPGPWMSREMRQRAGLPNPEERVGQDAHDFLAVACAAPRAILSRPRRRDGAPAVPSRFLVRLDAWLTGQGAPLPADPATGWAPLLDQPVGPPQPVTPPAPRPAARHRPRRLSVTEIETLIADPYAIYARHVLKLRPLKPLEEATDHADYGMLVHAGLHRFFTDVGTRWPPDAKKRLREALEAALGQERLRPALAEWWAPRLSRIADWVTEQETERRAKRQPTLVRTEIKGEWTLDIDGPFLMTGRADRIETSANGIAILDYKTGVTPTDRDVRDGDAPQLPLEAAMAEAGAFGAELKGITSELVYWHLTGGYEPGKAHHLLKSDPAIIAEEVEKARVALRALLIRFSQEDAPYLSQPHPGRRPRFPDYAHLARCAEWDVLEDAS